MGYESPHLPRVNPLSDAKLRALLGGRPRVGDSPAQDRVVEPGAPHSLGKPDAMRLFPEHFLIAGLMLASFVGAVLALVR